MPLYSKRAFIGDPISIAIGNSIYIPSFAMVPTQELFVDGQAVGTKTGKYIENFNYYNTFGGISAFPTSFVFSDLEGVYGTLLGGLPLSTTSVSAPNLVYVGSSLCTPAGPVSYSNLTSINFPKLVVSGSFLNGVFPALTTLNVNSLVETSLSSLTANALLSLNLPSVKILNGGLTFTGTSATSINLSSLVACLGSGGITLTAGLCTTLTLPSLGTWKILGGNFTASGCALNQASVDSVLDALAYMDGANNTQNFGGGRIVNLSSGTSSAPSNAGSQTTAGSNFSGVLTLCTVNLAGHGYSTGDVLRVSGVTGLTNANRYAVITVVNSNQFTYSITSQTATGGGTATLIKANASAKALVTRGVSLTTN